MRPGRTPASSPQIRRAQSADLCDVTALLRALLGYHAELDPALRLRAGTEGKLQELARGMLADRDVAVFLGSAVRLQSPRAPSGLCVLQVERAPPFLEEPRRAQISELFVREEARRTGVGRALTAAALAHARELGIRRLEVRVSTRNLAGQRFWRALGFRDFMDVLDLRL